MRLAPSIPDSVINFRLKRLRNKIKKDRQYNLPILPETQENKKRYPFCPTDLPPVRVHPQ
jgi:hypothetical protein